jgi:hypothetical protein
MVVHDPSVMPLARDLLACFAQELDKVENPPAYVQFRAGTVVDHLLSTTQDECCEGLGWVRPAGFLPSSSVFPQQDEAPLPKGTNAWAITLELGVIRCMPTPDETEIPTGEQWDAVTQVIMDDAAAMRRAICCFIAAVPSRVRRTLPREWQPISIQGGCVGGVMSVVIQGPACDCNEAGPESS